MQLTNIHVHIFLRVCFVMCVVLLFFWWGGGSSGGLKMERVQEGLTLPAF